MKHSNFVHLHLHTMYSLLDGAIRLEHLMKRASEFKMPAVAITDHGNMFGAVDFYQTAEKYGIKPIIGCEIYVAPGSRHEKRAGKDHDVGHHLVLLAKNRQGYQNLCQLVTKGYFEGFYYRPRIDKELLTLHHEGLIALSACLHGVVAVHLGRGERQKAEDELRFYRDLFTNRRFFLELQDNGIADQYQVNEQLLDLAETFKLPLVATNDCHYLMADDARAHEVLLCIQTGKHMDDPSRMQYGTDQLYFKSPEEMAASFADYPEAIANTIEIAERCNYKFEFGHYHPPHYVPPKGQSLNQYLEHQSRDGFGQRLPKIKQFYGADFTAELEEHYRMRLESELAMINKMGFAGYFLIVADFVNYARQRGIPVGPGRGSAAGSLVAYALKITDIDPLPYGLLFERFLNPERVSMPDIDMDFCIRGREEVIRYVTEKYGADRVAQIITFGKMQAKGVIRDVGRGLNMPYAEVDKIAKLIPSILNISLDQAMAMEKRLADLKKGSAQEQQLLKIAHALEGLNRHASIHAAGVVVTNHPLVEYLPLYSGQNGEIVTQYDMKKVEELGLIKFDFLGLKTLTVINNAVRLINRDQEAGYFDLGDIPLDDQQTYELLASGATTGVFQLESSGMQSLIRRLVPSCFEDIIALVALYRPGPLNSGMIDDFIDRKHGRQKNEYLLPELEPILKDTYGVIVYQEQVMKIAQVLAGYSLGEADILRRAMGKKKPEEMAKQRERFMSGAKANKIREKEAGDIFDLMAMFAEYGFNKSHSAAYAYISYQTAYLKAHYPVEFMAALLMEDMQNSDKVIKNIAECKEMKIKVLPPDVNESSISFTVVDEGIRFGLAAIKNVGGKAAEELIRERDENGMFSSIFDFCQRVDLQKVNKRVIESLIKAGAFDSTGVSRAKMAAVVEDAIDAGQRIMRDKQRGQLSLFDLVGDGHEEVDNGYSYPDIDEWSGKIKLANEREALGFYITGHPLQQRVAEMRRCGTVEIVKLTGFRDQSRVRIGGLVAAVKEKRTAKGKLMGFINLEDVTGTVDVTLFPDAFQLATPYIDSQEPLVIEGRVEVDDEKANAKVVATTVLSLKEATEKMVNRVVFTLQHKQLTTLQLSRLQKILSRHRGNCPGYVTVRMSHCEAVLSLSEQYNIQPSTELLQEVNDLFGYSVVEFQN
ncbi:MAG: DNA polymerase III subunit alpha [Deltaproteobacteria bacterium]|nr:DNA polymerase III subunit alpha [Candidatus Anaeroferrophillus wilburensis]MBN2889955.1 DNA polymerase III subunit alpha [Deltaproteobacteria bacterium]